MTFQKGHIINVGRKKKPHSEETKAKISKALKGKIPWNKGETGVYSDEIRKKMSKSGSIARNILWQKPQYRKKVSEARKGLKRPEETRKKMSEVAMGHPVSEETRRKLSEANKGEKSNFWKGGISRENDRIRASMEFRLWREAVFTRDRWTCQKCKEKGVKLNSHHLQGFSKYPDFRFTIDNGVTLCERCHVEFHNSYGRTDNIKEQFFKFSNKEHGN